MIKIGKAIRAPSYGIQVKKDSEGKKDLVFNNAPLDNRVDPDTDYSI